MQEISFSVDGQTLHGTLCYPKKVKDKNPAVLFVHGWMSNKETPSNKGVPEKLTQLGFICMNFDLRSHGESEGNREILSRQDYLNDLCAAYDFLALQEGVDKENITIVGSSFGGYLAILLTKQRIIKNLALRVPANYPDEGFNDSQFLFSGDDNPSILFPRFKALVGKETYAVRALQTFSGNVLIVESEKDETIPHEVIQSFLQAIQDKDKLTHIILRNASHSLRDQKIQLEYSNILVDWFKDKV